MRESEAVRDNRAFEEMRKVAVDWLAGLNPGKIAENAGFAYDERAAQFSFASLGTDVRVDYPSYQVTPKLEQWQHLVILHYMKLADGAPLTGQWMTMAEVKDGMVRGGDFDRRCERAICDRLSRMSEDELAEKCRSIGGRAMESNADFTARFDFLPRYPLLLKLWYADEEFPASGKLLLDRSADHYLPIEDAVTVGQLIMEKLLGMF